MNIKIQPHKGIIKIFTILNLTGYKDDNGKPFHPLRIKILKDLEGKLPQEKIEKFNTLKNEDFLEDEVLSDTKIQELQFVDLII